MKDKSKYYYYILLGNLKIFIWRVNIKIEVQRV